MKNKQINIYAPKNVKFLWKYLDLHKFISFLTDKELFFTRLDNYDDPFEGIQTKILRKNAISGNSIQKTDSSILDSQKKNYVNCWFASNRESMAMWNLYSNSDSVVIKVEFDLLKTELNTSFEKFVVDTSNLEIIGKSIEYRQLNPFDTNLPKQSFKYSALKKDVAFSYENEYRFLIKRKSDPVDSFYKIPVNISDLKLQVLTHPNMEDWKFGNIQKLINLTGAKNSIEVKKSETLLRQRNCYCE